MIDQAFSKLSYGLYVVTASASGKLGGQIANSVFQVTSAPPTLAICINQANFTHSLIQDSGIFGVNILDMDTDLKFIGRFGFRSQRDFDKFSGIRYSLGPRGSPLLEENTVGFVEARVLKTIDMGSHTLFIGEVTFGEVFSEKEPMTYAHYRQVKGGKTPKSAPTYHKAP